MRFRHLCSALFLIPTLILNGHTAQATPVAQENCAATLEPTLQPLQAAALCKAVQLKEDLSGAALTDEMLVKAGARLSDAQKTQVRAMLDGISDFPPYTLNLVNNVGHDANCVHPVAILGEKHLKFRKASEVGKTALRQFRFRGTEGFQIEKVRNLSRNSQTGANETLNLINDLAKKKILFEPTVRDGHDVGISVQDGNIFDFKNRRTLYGPSGEWRSSYGALALFLTSKGTLNSMRRCWSPYAPLTPEVRDATQSPTKFAEAFQDLLKDDPDANFGFHLEEGEYDAAGADCSNFSSDSCQKFILEQRNEKMARNIRKIVAVLPCGEPFLVIVGQAHSPGIEKLLEEP